MVELLLTLMIILSGSVFGIATKRFSHAWGIPISVMSAVTVIYLFGLFGFMEGGLYAIILISVGFWGYSAYIVLKQKNIKLFMKDFLSPVFFIFICLFFMIHQCNAGRLATDWDAFSCWVYRVKSMVNLNDFTTNPLSRVGYKSYPPAMACFQYMIQKLHMLGRHTDEFSEWRIFYAYQLFVVTLFFPLLKGIKDYSKPMRLFFAFFFVLVIPLQITSEYYEISYIDPVVGIMGGLGLSILLVEDTTPEEKILYYVFLCWNLVLMKDVGLLVALFVALCFGITYVNEKETRRDIRSLIVSCIPLIVTIAAKVSWIFKLSTSNVSRSFPEENIDLFSYAKWFFGGNAPGYYQDVINGIKNNFETKSWMCIFPYIRLTYSNLLFVGIFVLFVCTLLQLKKNTGAEGRRYAAIGIITVYNEPIN